MNVWITFAYSTEVIFKYKVWLITSQEAITAKQIHNSFDIEYARVGGHRFKAKLL